ncbi:O-antigen ligase family protein [Leptolyngbya sp. FACHB-17]|uniref:O-antigen ligase family protein n=1 Tax=unclassified Leptolyngbya TaxID=2650499 RepID=UPI00168078B1|nr:O-antigen ligase family protein [Leptolyngbya sp. FACHB-17]MBD2080445.1 O-antigen ligase family protein [Leptolyngbya sp. FACHB-17]
MREIFFNPIVLLLVAVIGAIYLLLFSSWVTREENNHRLRWLITFIFLFSGLHPTVAPFPYFQPEALAGFDKSPESAFVQLTFYSAIALLLSSWFRSFFSGLLYLGKNPFLFGLLLLALLSAFWSETPILCFRYGLVFLFATLFAIHIAREYSFKALCVILRRLAFVSGIINLCSPAIVPSLAIKDKGLSGIMPFPIDLGNFLAFGVALWVSYGLDAPKQERWKAFAIAGFLGMVMLMANSAQSIFICVVLTVLVIVLQSVKFLDSKYFPVLLIGGLILAIVTSVIMQYLLPLIFAALGKDMSLTGRTEFWPQLIDRLEQHNLFVGYGINSFWQAWRGDDDPAHGIIIYGGFIPTHAHNGFIDLALSLGVFGLILFFMSWFVGLAQAVKYSLQNGSADCSLPLLILVYLVFFNVSHTLLTGANYIWVLYTIALIRLQIEYRQQRKSAPELQSVRSLPV